MNDFDRLIKDFKRKGIEISEEELIATIARNRRVRREAVDLYVEVMKVIQPELDKLFKVAE